MSLITAKRFTIDEYCRLGELGFFADDDRVELLTYSPTLKVGDS
ncbi:hypothetical protein [Chrysosporum bergii]